MSDELTRVKRLPEKQSTDKADLYAILDAALLAHVGIVDDGQPLVIAMACARDGDRLLLHGSTGSRLMRNLAEGAPACVTVTLLDGLVLARSAFESSMHYRGAMVFGIAQVVGAHESLDALHVLTEHLIPGRWDELREPTKKELAATLILSIPLDEWSVKISAGPPDDPDEDLDAPVWAGVVPLVTATGTPVPAPDLRGDPPLPEAIAAIDAQLRDPQP